AVTGTDGPSSAARAGRRQGRTVRAATPPATALTARPAVSTAARRFVTRPPGGRLVRASSSILPRDPFGDGRDHLVPDGPDDPPELLRRDPFLALLADQHDLVPHRHVLVAAVHEDLVHGHRSGNPVTVTSDQHVGPGGEDAGVAARVADLPRRAARHARTPTRGPAG